MEIDMRIIINRLLFTLFVLFNAIFCDARIVMGAEATLEVCQNCPYSSIADAVRDIQPGMESVIVKVSGKPVCETEPEIHLRMDSGLKSFTLARDETSATGEVKICGINAIFANGIPFTLGEGVNLEETMIFGGADAREGQTLSVDKTEIRIEGIAWWVFGGGRAAKGGRSIVRDKTRVTIAKNGRTLMKAFGGGYALDAGSLVETEETLITVDGEADYVLGGGLAEDGGAVRTRSISKAAVSSSGKVTSAIFGGAGATGKNSFCETLNASVELAGWAKNAFGGDFVFENGKGNITGEAILRILPSGKVENAHAGSFVSDNYSDAVVNNTRLINQGGALNADAYGQCPRGRNSIVTGQAIVE